MAFEQEQRTKLQAVCVGNEIKMYSEHLTTKHTQKTRTTKQMWWSESLEHKKTKHLIRDTGDQNSNLVLSAINSPSRFQNRHMNNQNFPNKPQP